MEFKSEYYSDFMQNMQKYGVDPSAYEFAGEIQALEEMMFAFNMTMLV
jgi:hypothetical protein